jgi:hypothetical protein
MVGRTVNVGIALGAYLPYALFDDKERAIGGADMDTARVLAKKLNFTLNVVTVDDWVVLMMQVRWPCRCEGSRGSRPRRRLGENSRQKMVNDLPDL